MGDEEEEGFRWEGDAALLFFFLFYFFFSGKRFAAAAARSQVVRCVACGGGPGKGAPTISIG